MTDEILTKLSYPFVFYFYAVNAIKQLPDWFLINNTLKMFLGKKKQNPPSFKLPCFPLQPAKVIQCSERRHVEENLEIK